jgi:hypothetical protein
VLIRVQTSLQATNPLSRQQTQKFLSIASDPQNLPYLPLLPSTYPPPALMADDDYDYELFRYTPNLGAAIFFTILFALAALLHTYQVTATRTWFFIAFLVGGYCESAHCGTPADLLSAG